MKYSDCKKLPTFLYPSPFVNSCQKVNEWFLEIKGNQIFWGQIEFGSRILVEWHELSLDTPDKIVFNKETKSFANLCSWGHHCLLLILIGMKIYSPLDLEFERILLTILVKRIVKSLCEKFICTFWVKFTDKQDKARKQTSSSPRTQFLTVL